MPYNGILGRPALAKFMAASHYAYNTLKMPGPMTIITIPSNKKDALTNYTSKQLQQLPPLGHLLLPLGPGREEEEEDR